jgi:hypothetical protein
VRILAVSSLLGLGLPALTASCAWPPPQAAAPPPSPTVAVTAPVALVEPPPPAAIAAEPAAPVAVAAGPVPPAREVEYVPFPFLWPRMLGLPPPAGRLMLNNFSFEPTRVQAVLASGPACAIGPSGAAPGAATEFVLPPNGTRVLPAPPGFDICWRRELIAGETKEIPPAGPWTAWSRAYTGSGRFLDTVVVTPSPPDIAVAMAERAPAARPPVLLGPHIFPPVEK